ncbi:hypothetical protein ACLOJK_004972 [Asimina triloba]
MRGDSSLRDYVGSSTTKFGLRSITDPGDALAETYKHLENGQCLTVPFWPCEIKLHFLHGHFQNEDVQDKRETKAMRPQHRLDIVALLRPARFCRQFIFLPCCRLVIMTLSSLIVLFSPLLDVRENQVRHRSLHARRSSPYRVSSSAHRRHIVRTSSSSIVAVDLPPTRRTPAGSAIHPTSQLVATAGAVRPALPRRYRIWDGQPLACHQSRRRASAAPATATVRACECRPCPRKEDVAPPAALPSWSLTVRPLCHRICPSCRRDGFLGEPWLPHVAARIYPLVTIGIVLAARRRLTCCLGPEWGRCRPFTTLPSPPDERKMESFFACYRTTGIAPDLRFLYNLIRGLLKMGDFYRAILTGVDSRGRVHAIKIQLLHFDVRAVEG